MQAVITRARNNGRFWPVGWSRAVAGGSALFDEAATRALVERDLARTRDVASMLVDPTTVKVDPDHDFVAALPGHTS